MFSRDAHQFILAPWEYRGATFDARPDFVTRLDIGGGERTFLIKVKRNALWFREAERDANWTFGLLSPLEADSEGARNWARDGFIVEWFESELRAGNFGRVVVWEDFANYLGCFIFLFGADGRGVAREPWDERGLDFSWESSVQFGLAEFLDWPCADFEKLARALDDNHALLHKFGDRDVPEHALEGEELHWICGSRAELEQLTRALAFWLWDWRGENLTFAYDSESEHGGATLASILDDDYIRGADIAPGIRRLTDLFLDYHTPVGFRWEFQDASGGRDSWDPEPLAVLVEVEVPTAHEKLEAGLFLREWLRGKVAAAEVDELLKPTA